MAQTPNAIPNQQAPNHISQLAAVYDLGELTTVYKPKHTNSWLILGIALAAITVDIVAVFLTNATIANELIYPLIVGPILAWTIGVLPSANLRIYIFTYGFIHARGRKGEVVRWDQIATIREHVSGASFTYIVQRDDGRIFKQGTPLINSREMGIRMMREITKIHLPLAKMAYESGQTLSFGKLKVNMQGLSNGRKIVPWNQIGRVTTRKGIICTEKDGRLLKWSFVKAANVPNLSVLVALVNQIVQDQ